MKKDVRIIVQNIQRYDDYTDKIVTNAIGNFPVVVILFYTENYVQEDMLLKTD